MADNIDVTPGSGATVHADEYTHTTYGLGKSQVIKIVDATPGGEAPAAVDANGLAVKAVGAAAENAAAAGNPVLVAGRRDVTPRALGDGDAGAPALSASGAMLVRLTDTSDNEISPSSHNEDDAHSDGDPGVQVLAVRRDAKAVGSGTDGDFSTHNVNSVGDLRVDGGQVTYIDVTLTCDTSILAVGDVIADSQLVAGVVRANDANGVLHSVCIIDIDDQAQAVDLVFMRTSTSLGTENAAISISAANLAAGLIGVVSVAAADYDDFINAQAATLTNLGLAIDPVAGADDIYIGAVCRSGTPTYTASGLQLRLGFIAD